MTPTAAVGVTEHGNSAVLVTVASEGKLLDRRRVDLTEDIDAFLLAMGKPIGPPWQARHKLAAAAALAAMQRPSRR